MMHEPLVFNQPRRPARSHFDRTLSIGNRARRIGDKTIERGLRVRRRRIERELAVWMKVELFRGDVLFRRPLTVLDPLVQSRSERHCFRALRTALVFQIVREERRENVLAIVFRRRASEIDRSKLAAFTSRPAAVVPRTDDEEVLFRRVVTFEQFVDLDWTVEVFLVPPTSDVQRRHRNSSEPRLEALPLPERVVVRMVDEVVPARQTAFEILRASIRQRPAL